MMNRREQGDFGRTDAKPTAADYIAAGAAPLLIMVMVGALVWFVQDLVYQGEHALRLRWTLFWFVIGMVGVSRIAIERTPAYAGVFGFGLAAVVAIMIHRFFPMPLTGWFLLGLIWWCTNKLVWDCTLIDDNEDASGEGLLEIAGIDETAGNHERDDVAVRHIDTGRRNNRTNLAWWRRSFANPSGRNGQPHAHGLWILYFSLAALPVFGLGQRLLAGPGRDSPGLALLAVYLAAAISLLLLTSFLGLRRYLRQRRLTMPARIAAGWIGTGMAIAVMVLVLSLVLPRPPTMASLHSAGDALSGRQLEERNVMEDQDSDRESAETDPAGENGRDSNGRDGRESGVKPSESEERRQKQGDDRGNADGDAQTRTTETTSESAPALQPPSMPDWFRWLAWAVLACALIFVAVRHRREIVEAIRELIDSLRGLFRREPAKRGRTRRGGPSAGLLPPQVRFDDLTNPFRPGEEVDPAAAVRRTYEALELWAAERGKVRAPDVTSMEFAQSLMSAHPELRAGIRQLARLHAGLLYAGREPEEDELPPLAELWDAMESQQPASVPR